MCAVGDSHSYIPLQRDARVMRSVADASRKRVALVPGPGNTRRWGRRDFAPDQPTSNNSHSHQFTWEGRRCGGDLWFALRTAHSLARSITIGARNTCSLVGHKENITFGFNYVYPRNCQLHRFALANPHTPRLVIRDPIHLHPQPSLSRPHPVRPLCVYPESIRTQRDLPAFSHP